MGLLFLKNYKKIGVPNYVCHATHQQCLGGQPIHVMGWVWTVQLISTFFLIIAERFFRK